MNNTLIALRVWVETNLSVISYSVTSLIGIVAIVFFIWSLSQ